MLMACTGAPPKTCTSCGDRCVELLVDSQHCGACNHACAAAERCDDGFCRLSCAGLQCGGVCVDPRTDPDHCGACGVTCNAAHAARVCVNGRCERGTCEPGWFDCDGEASNGCELDDGTCQLDLSATDAGFQGYRAWGLSADGKRVLLSGFTVGPLWLYEVPTRTRRALTTRLDGLLGTTRAAALSGDGMVVELMYSLPLLEGARGDAIYRLDLGTSQLGTLEVRDAGPLSQYELGLSHNGRYTTLGISACDGGPCALWVDVQTGAFVEAPSLFSASLSPDGLTLGLMRADAGESGNVRWPYQRDVAQGTEALLAVPDAGAWFPPVFSFDAGVAAISRFGPGLPLTVLATRSGPMPGRDGGIKSFIGASPSLSYDGRRLAVVAANRCSVFDVETERELAGIAFASDGQLSGDGHTLLCLQGGSRLLMTWVP